MICIIISLPVGNLAGAVDAYEMGMQYAAQMTDKKLYDNIKFYIDDLKTKHDQGTAQWMHLIGHLLVN